jgi:adenylate kinase family enzyme
VLNLENDTLKSMLLHKKNILVIGPGGAGKSTLASKIAQYLKIQVYHLDKIYWEAGWKAISKQKFEAEVDKIMKSPTPCIIDGDYSFNLEKRLKHADLIIWLDIPLYICIFNIIKRRLKNINRSRPDVTEGCKERLSLSFFIYTLKYKQRSGQKTKKLIDERYNKELIMFNKYKDVKKIKL